MKQAGTRDPGTHHVAGLRSGGPPTGDHNGISTWSPRITGKALMEFHNGSITDFKRCFEEKATEAAGTPIELIIRGAWPASPTVRVSMQKGSLMITGSTALLKESRVVEMLGGKRSFAWSTQKQAMCCGRTGPEWTVDKVKTMLRTALDENSFAHVAVE